MSTGAPYPWDQRPDETGRQYEAFKAFRDLPPPDRSIQNTYNVLHGTTGAQEGRKRGARGAQEGRRRAPGKFMGLHNRFEWSDRVKAWDARHEAARMEAEVEVIKAQAEDSVGRVLREQAEWLTGQKENCRKMARQGAILNSFPPRDRLVDSPEGPVIIKAAHAREILAGGRLLAEAHRLMAEIHRSELAIASVARAEAPGRGTQTPDEIKASDLAQLEAAAAWVYLAAAGGDRESLNDLLRNQERKARLLGLDAPPATAPPGQSAGATPPDHINVGGPRRYGNANGRDHGSVSAPGYGPVGPETGPETGPDPAV